MTTIDSRIADYARERWDDLLAAARAGCPRAGDDEAQEIVLSALARAATRLRPAGPDELAGRVAAALDRACLRHRRRTAEDLREDVQVMEVGAVGQPPGVGQVTSALPDAGVVDATALLARRIRHARYRRWAFVSAGTAAVVLVAVLAGPARTGHRPARPRALRPTAAVAPTTLPLAPTSSASAVALGGGHLWTLELHPSARHARTTLVRRDPATGRQQATYRVPGEDFGVAYGYGRLRVWGQAATGKPASVVGIVDPATHAVQVQRVRHVDTLAGVAFAAGYAWFAEPQVGRVLLVGSRAGEAMLKVTVGGARGVAATSPTSVAVSSLTGDVWLLPVNQPLADSSSAPSFVASAPSYGMWIGGGNVLGYRAQVNAPASVLLRLPLPAGLVTGDPTHGVYVATRSMSPRHYDPYLVYYSPAALRTAQPRPTASLSGRVQVESLVSRPAGGVVFVTSDGGLTSWDPGNRGTPAVSG